MTATLQHDHKENHHPRRAAGTLQPGDTVAALPLPGGSESNLDWRDETGAQTAEYGIVTLAAVGFAGVLAVVLAGTDVQGLLLDIVKNALSFG